MLYSPWPVNLLTVDSVRSWSRQWKSGWEKDNESYVWTKICVDHSFISNANHSPGIFPGLSVCQYSHRMQCLLGDPHLPCMDHKSDEGVQSITCPKHRFFIKWEIQKKEKGRITCLRGLLKKWVQSSHWAKIRRCHGNYHQVQSCTRRCSPRR